jgi:hypothetical protein
LCRVILPCRLCFGGVFVPGPREVTEAFCKFPLCVLVCFGLEGCLLVPRSSSTSMAAWARPTWVVSQRRVLEAGFVLLESPPPSRRIFIGSHFTPPSLVPVSVLQVVSEPIQVFIGFNQSKIHGWRTRNGVRVLHTSMARLPNVE